MTASGRSQKQRRHRAGLSRTGVCFLWYSHSLFLCWFKEYVEKPLKLVLKVGGNEVAELSTGNAGLDSSLYEDKSEHEKHKDRKRKKRKKGEKQVPGEEKEKRKRKVKVCVHATAF